MGIIFVEHALHTSNQSNMLDYAIPEVAEAMGASAKTCLVGAGMKMQEFENSGFDLMFDVGHRIIYQKMVVL